MCPPISIRDKQDFVIPRSTNPDEERYFNLDDSRNELHKTPSKRSISSLKQGSIASRRQSSISEDKQSLDEVNLSSLDLAQGNPSQTSTANQSDSIVNELIAKALRDQIIDTFFASESKQIVRDSVLQINDEYQEYQAMKIVQKRMIKSVTKKFITDIIQESTDAIYQFEDDSISTADYILKHVLKLEIRKVLDEVIRHGFVSQHS